MKILWIAQVHYKNKNAHPAPWIHTLANALAKRSDIDLTILNFSTKLKRKEIKIKNESISYVFLRVLHPKVGFILLYLDRIQALRKYIKRNRDKYDLIHIHGSEHLYQTIAGRFEIPMVLSIQGVLYKCITYIKKWNLKWLLWSINSYFEKKYLKKIKYFSVRTSWDSEIADEMNNNNTKFKIWEMIRPQFFIEESLVPGKNILFVGGTNPLKGINVLLKTIDKIEINLDIKVLLCGNVDKTILDSLYKKLNIKQTTIKRIEIKGFSRPEQLLQYYKESFCLVHPSYMDNSPNSVCEAQVAGLPVIASNVGGVPSLIEHNVTGFLTTLDPAEIFNCILRLYKEPEKWKEISTRSRIIARKRHDPTTIMQTTLNMYNKLLVKQ